MTEVGPLFGNSIYPGRHEIDCGYPLGADALRMCFGGRQPRPDQSIEDMFSEALEHRDYSPIEALAGQLMKADYYLARQLVSRESNCYLEFFRTFTGSQFLTFNYDSLPEAILFHMGRWYPRDGYGTQVRAELPPWKESEYSDRKSSSMVLHLHGSLCVTTSEFQTVRKSGSAIGWIEEREKPLFAFDPASIGGLFGPFQRRPGDFDVRDRIIAPVRDKSDGLRRIFVRTIHERALELVRYSGAVVSIGYSFGNHDKHSYEPILNALAGSHERRLTLISPHASKLSEKLQSEFSSLNIYPMERTFKEWWQQGFRLGKKESEPA